MKYKNTKIVTIPKDLVKDVQVLIDNGRDSFSIAKIKSFILIVASLLLSKNILSQISVTEQAKSDKNENITIEQSIEPYDSLENLEDTKVYSEYKKYIGQQLYLIPFQKERIANSSKYNSYYTKRTLLFSNNPVLLPIDKTNENLTLKEKYTTTLDLGYTQQYLEFDFIYTNIYKPFHYFSQTYRDMFSSGSNITEACLTNSNVIGDKYYTLIDVIYGDELKEITKKWAENFKEKKAEINKLKTRKKNWKKSEKIWVQDNVQDNRSRLSNVRYSFVLTDNISGDTVFTMNANPLKNFILVPYFVKQKELFESKYLRFKGQRGVIEDLSSGKLEDVGIEIDSKWFCEEVTLLKPSYSMVYILKNEKGVSIATPIITDFIYEEAYIKKRNEVELLAKQLEEQNRIEEEKKKEKESIEKENYRKECIQKYGEKYGNLVLSNKVEVGMSKEMCRDALGFPSKVYQLETENKTYDIWNYLSIVKLYFIDDELSKIEKTLY